MSDLEVPQAYRSEPGRKCELCNRTVQPPTSWAGAYCCTGLGQITIAEHELPHYVHVLVIQHQPEGPPGLIAPWLDAIGARRSVWCPAADQHVDELETYDAIVSLGSAQSVYDSAVRWISTEIDLLERAIATATPVLGVCFGAQCLAVAAGGGVQRMHEPELGWISLDDETRMVGRGPWFSWHGDVIDPPPGAVVLGRSPRAHQAFAMGPHLGVQFHPEIELPTIEACLDRHGIAGSRRARIEAESARYHADARLAALELLDSWRRTWP